MEEKPEKIQLAQQIAVLLDKVNNTSLKKHRLTCRISLAEVFNAVHLQTSRFRRTCAPEKLYPT